jgi:hypothetical protein
MSIDLSALTGIADGAALVRNVAPPEAPLAWSPMLTFRTDWHGTVQAAINAAAAAGGGRVEVTSGDWSESVTISTSNIELVGVSWSSVLTSSNASQVVRVDGSGVLSKIRIANLSIVGDYTKTDQKGVFFAGATDVIVEGCYIADCGDSGVMAADFSEFRRAVIQGNTISHCGNFGVVLNADDTAGLISDVVVSNNYLAGFASVLYPAHAIYVKGAYRVTVTGNVCSDVDGISSASGILVSAGAEDVAVTGNVCIDSPSGITVSNPGTVNVAVSGNTCADMAEGYGVYVYDGAAHVAITGNTLRNGTGIARGITVLEEGANRCSAVTITGNHVTGFASGGCFLSGADEVAVVGNTFDLEGNIAAYTVDVKASTKVLVAVNRIVGGDRCVMVREAASQNVTVALNTIAGAATYGVRVDTAVSEAVVVLNDCREFAGSGLAVDIGSSSSWQLLNVTSGACVLGSTNGLSIGRTGESVGFYGTAPVAKQTGVPVTAAGIHAALVNLGLITT